MQPAGIGIGWPWIAGLALLALAGLFVIWRGLYPRRQGTTPYCRKCGYNLTGKDRTAEDARCPECGFVVSADDAVIFGERVRRWRRVFAGLVIFLFGAVPLVLIGIGVARGIDWYRYKPTGLVIRDLQSADSNLAGKGAREITRRYLDKKLSKAQVHKLAEVCLAEQRRPDSRFTATQVLIDLLGTMYQRRELAQNQIDRFFENLCPVECVARPTVIRGRDCPLELRWESRVPRSGVWAMLAPQDTRFARHPRGHAFGRDFEVTGPVSHTIVRAAEPARKPGRHELPIDVELRVYDSGIPGEDVGNPVRTISRTVTAEFEVLEDEPPDYISLVRSPELDAQIRDAVRVHQVELRQRTGGLGNAALSCEIEIRDPLPIGLAFDAFAE
jgi:predicted RNA-binding Zn-ribbon protein involved in translation (DUF1610 family)